ncbi:MAG: cytochrome c maturation protein CcmE [Terricaulis sp.]
MKRKHQRLLVLAVGGALLAAAATLTFAGLRGQIIYFVTPTELAEVSHPGQRLRLGGLVVEGSMRRDAEGGARFNVTDGESTVEVRYDGLLPDLFREGQGVVAEGIWQGDMGFAAERVLAKHDETYMPPEVAEALRRRGEWRGGAPVRSDSGS